MVRSLKLPVSQDRLCELDGVPLTGRVSVASPAARIENGIIRVSWIRVEKKGKAKIWLSTTNNFNNGGQDAYRQVKSVSLKARRAEIDVSDGPSDFYKNVIQGKYNEVNRWVTEPLTIFYLFSGFYF